MGVLRLLNLHQRIARPATAWQLGIQRHMAAGPDFLHLRPMPVAASPHAVQLQRL